MKMKDSQPEFFADMEGDATPFAAASRLVTDRLQDPELVRAIECPVCGEPVLAMRQGRGRMMKHRLLEVEVPPDFPLPECASCGARPIDWKTAELLDPALEKAYQEKVSSSTRPPAERVLGESLGTR